MQREKRDRRDAGLSVTDEFRYFGPCGYLIGGLRARGSAWGWLNGDRAEAKALFGLIIELSRLHELLALVSNEYDDHQEQARRTNEEDDRRWNRNDLRQRVVLLRSKGE